MLDQFRHYIRHGKAAGPAIPEGEWARYQRERGDAMDLDVPAAPCAPAHALGPASVPMPMPASVSVPVPGPVSVPVSIPVPVLPTPVDESAPAPVPAPAHTQVAEDLVRQENAARPQLPAYPGLTERYQLLSKMGDGAFSNVYHAVSRSTGDECAIKVVRRAESSGTAHLDAQFRRKHKATERAGILKEVQIMRRLNHGNIVRLLEFSESDDFYFLVLELVKGGELFHQIARLTYFSEALARHVILQVAEAIRYMHEQGVVHRDIKPENILFEPIPLIPSKVSKARPYDEDKADEGEFIPGVGGGGIGRVKIADFGLSKVVWEGWATSPCGTIGYTAPEIVRRSGYSKSVDMWALGCVLYTLLCGFPPFYDESIATLTQKVARGEYTFLSPWWDDVSESAKDLVRHLLTVDPRQRYTIDQFLAHPWCRAPQSVPFLTPGGLAIAQRMPLGSPLLSVLRSSDPALTRQARAGLGLTTPGVQQLKEAFDVSYAVHRMGEESIVNNYIYGPPGGLVQLNEEEDEEDEALPLAAHHGALHAAHPAALSQPQSQPQSHTPSHTPRASGAFQLNLNNATLLKNRGICEPHLHRAGRISPRNPVV